MSLQRETFLKMCRKKDLVLCADVLSKAMPDSAAGSAASAAVRSRFPSLCNARFLLRSSSCLCSASRSASRTRMQHPFRRILHTVTRHTIPARHVRIRVDRKTRAVSARQLTSLPRSLRGTRHHPQIRLWLGYPKGLEMAFLVRSTESSLCRTRDRES